MDFEALRGFGAGWRVVVLGWAMAGLFAGCKLDPILRKEGPSKDELLPPAGRMGSRKARKAGSGGKCLPELLFDSEPRTEKKPLPGALLGFQQVFADVAEGAIPAVVSISSERNVGQSDPGQYDEFLDNGPFRYFFGLPEGRGRKARGRRRKETGLGSGRDHQPGRVCAHQQPRDRRRRRHPGEAARRDANTRPRSSAPTSPPTWP